jgi:AraC-like DNA-binding protein
MDKGKSFSSRKIDHFLVITILLFILDLFNIIYKFGWHNKGLIARVNLWNPTWLLFGPLLYFGLRNLKMPGYRMRAKDLVHFVPFMLFLVFFVVAYWQTDMKDPWATNSFVYYQNSYLVIVFSLIPYSVHTFSRILKEASDYFRQAELLLISISGIYVMAAIVVTMVFFAWGIVHINMGFDYRYFSYALLFFVNIAITWYWMLPKEVPLNEPADDLKSKSYSHSELAPEQAKHYQSKISEHFKNTLIYLTPNLSLEVLSKDLDIPKHYLSQIFNVHFEKNFHSFLADYRIAHALKLLEENPGRLKIESLAYSCGFNSKTSFNRYFKEITGHAPSAYQENLKKAQEKGDNPSAK